MNQSMTGQLRPAILSLALLSLLTGIIYPLVVTGVAEIIFPAQANGSLITAGGKTVGSELIGQPFDDPKYFWSRPSATSPYPYNAAASSGSNLGPTNAALVHGIADRIKALQVADPGNKQPVPVDLVTASGSGLDPDVSVASALYQVSRVARARGLDEATVRNLVDQHIEGRDLGIFGEPRVNVLQLNLALDAQK
jgi:K+-transporting ATPase ATPase C chain